MSRLVGGSAAAGRFTLVELLVVLAIIGVLAALLMPALHSSLATARRASCVNNLRNTYHGLSMYSDDHNGLIPQEWGTFPDIPDGYMGFTDWLHRLIYHQYIPGGFTIPFGGSGHCRNESVICPSRSDWIFTTRVGGFALNVYPPLVEKFGWERYRFTLFNRPSTKLILPEGTYFRLSIFDPPVTDVTDYRAAYRHQNEMNALFVDGHSGRFVMYGPYSRADYFGAK